jgi:hypothetical protein
VAGLMIDQVTALGARPPADDELAARKAALIGEAGRDAQTSVGLAERLAGDAVRGVGLDEWVRYAPSSAWRRSWRWSAG